MLLWVLRSRREEIPTNSQQWRNVEVLPVQPGRCIHAVPFMYLWKEVLCHLWNTLEGRMTVCGGTVTDQPTR